MKKIGASQGVGKAKRARRSNAKPRKAALASEEQSLHYAHPGFAALREAVEKLPGTKNA